MTIKVKSILLIELGVQLTNAVTQFLRCGSLIFAYFSYYSHYYSARKSFSCDIENDWIHCIEH